MKRFLTVLGTGFVLGLIVAPESGRRFRSRLAGLFQPARRRARKVRYQWRDPEDRLAAGDRDVREKMMDKTLADSFPASDPPSSIPDPSADSLVA
jgi:hypothetical protein